MPRPARRLVLLAVVVCGVGCDHLTKAAAVARLADGTVIEVVTGVVDLRYAENRGVAFNVLRWMPEPIRRPLLLLVGLSLTLGLAYVALWRGGRPPGEQLALSLLLAGALGNTVDRVVRGCVVDFVHLHHWPIFNLADALICAAIAGLLLQRLFARRGAAV